MLRNPLEVTAFPLSCHRTCQPSISILPQLVALWRRPYCLPLSCPNFMCLKFFWILSRSSCCMAFKAPTDTWSFLITCLGLLYSLNTRLCSQATLECVSHRTQAFVVLMFQSISQTTSLVCRHTPPKIAVNKIFQVCFLGLWLGTSVAFKTISEFLRGSYTLKSHSLEMEQVHWGSTDYHVRIIVHIFSYCKWSENNLLWGVLWPSIQADVYIQSLCLMIVVLSQKHDFSHFKAKK